MMMEGNTNSGDYDIMKYSHLFLVLFVCIAFVSCTEDSKYGETTSKPESTETRMIEVQFDASVKSSLSGFQPVFIDGDIIKVSNGFASEDCIVKVGETTTIMTTLSGKLKAVYPSSAAKMNGNAIEGVIVPSAQTGMFKDANIAMAEMEAQETCMRFKNSTALFIITPPEGTTSIIVKSLNQLESLSGQRTGNAVAINTDGTDKEAKLVVTAGDGKAVLGTYYVSLCAGVNLCDISFDTGKALKGIPVGTVSKKNTTASGVAYKISNTNWHPYAIIDGKKWAKMNIGAENEEDCGYFFAWGEVNGHKLNEEHTGFEENYNFSWANAPFNNGYSSYNKAYFDSIRNDLFPNYNLPLEYDAASSNWGGSWRMPTRDEYVELTEYYIYGHLFGHSVDNAISFPYAGYGEGQKLTGNTSVTCWTSTYSYSLSATYPGIAAYMFYIYGSISTSTIGRQKGGPIRPISD